MSQDINFPLRRYIPRSENKKSGFRRKGGNSIVHQGSRTLVFCVYRGRIIRRSFKGRDNYQKARRWYCQMRNLKVRELRFWTSMPYIADTGKAFVVLGFRISGRWRSRWRFPYNKDNKLEVLEQAKSKYFIVSEPRRLRDGFKENPYKEFDGWMPPPPDYSRSLTVADPLA